MKSVVIGVIVALCVAFAAHAAYTNFVAGSDQAPAATVSAPVTAQAEPAVATTLKRANTTTLAAATPAAKPVTVAPAAKPATQTKEAAKKEEEAKKAANTAKPTPIVTTVTTVRNAPVSEPASEPADTFSNPASVAEYDFAFVDTQAVSDPMANLSAATEQAVQDVYEETVLSPSAPR